MLVGMLVGMSWFPVQQKKMQKTIFFTEGEGELVTVSASLHVVFHCLLGTEPYIYITIRREDRSGLACQSAREPGFLPELYHTLVRN